MVVSPSPSPSPFRDVLSNPRAPARLGCGRARRPAYAALVGAGRKVVVMVNGDIGPSAYFRLLRTGDPERVV